jgi:alpha-1,3-rhamnosyl/mannosyltransferase
MHYPEHHPRDRVRFFERHFRARLDEVDHVITISDFVRRELIEQLAVEPRRVTAVPLAADSVFFPRSRAEVAAYLAGRRLPREYLLYVGTLEPRKNLSLLMRALALSKTDLPLICAGAAGWLNRDFEKTTRRLGLTNRVLCLGHVEDSSLALLYSGATAFVYPSLYEGFGLPVLEAMACGCPVICSDRASLPEVAGEAAVLVSPCDERGLAESLDSVIQDTFRRKELSRLGLARASRFSWQETAQQTIKVFRQVMAR